jgi:Cd2+/Zn2+-exporting ATPase
MSASHHSCACDCHADHPSAAPVETTRTPSTAAGHVSVFRIDQMDCPTEERLLRKALEPMAGVHSLAFNLLERTLRVQHSLDDSGPIASAIAGLNMSPVLLGSDGRPAQDTADVAPASAYAGWVQTALAGLLALGAEAIAYASGHEASWLTALLALGAIALGGLDTLKKGWLALRHLTLNINLLMTLAALGAVCIGQWPEAAVVIWLFGIAEKIESLSMVRARRAIQSLKALAPDTALVGQDDGTWQVTAVGSIAPDAVVRVRPGERIALDGVVMRGASSVDQASLTGESMPVEKTADDAVFAGSINQNGVLDYRVTATAGHTLLDRIAQSVQEAQGQRAPTQRFIDRFAQIYTPLVFALAVAVAIVAPLFLGQDWREWIYRALVLLVIACPCALVISTPVTIVSALAHAARRGILIKGGLYLERGRKLKSIALDKTGTLTHGMPQLTDVVAMHESGMTDAQALHVAASINALSTHPIARAIGMAHTASLADVRDFQSLPGRGVKGAVGGCQYYLGNMRLAGEQAAASPALQHAVDTLEKQGKTTVVLCTAGKALAVLAISDTIRQTSRAAVDELRKLGIQTVVLSGDNQAVVQRVATELGIDDARGNLLPDDKLDAVSRLRKRGAVGMVGDGVNDAPALARADIGFAMGVVGTDSAIETADVALMQDDLRKLPEFIRLSRRACTVLWQNIAFALAIKLVFFGLAFTGQATLWMAVFADAGTSLLVVVNGLRLLR